MIFGTGLYQKRIGEKNEARVKEYLEQNPDVTKKQACEDLKMVYSTLNKHIKNIESKYPDWTCGKVKR